MKKILSLIIFMLCAVSTYAESVPHAVFFTSSGEFLFTYAEAGTYKSGAGGVSAVFSGEQVINSGSGNPAWYNWNGNVKKVIFDPSFASARPKSTANWFHDCNKLTSIVGMKEYLNTSEVTNMSYMFQKCTVIESIDVSGFNTSNVTDMSYMFANCLRLWNLDVSNFNTSNVENMSNMFQSCSLNSLNLSNFNTSNVKNMSFMFNNCSNITSLDLSSFDTSNVTDMSYMFANCILLMSLDVSNFDTSKVTNMECMFFGFFFLSSVDLSNFNTSSVTNMCKMFSGSNFSELDLSNFDTSNVTNMQEMFSSAGALEKLDLSSFNTSKVTNMKNMFNYCTSLTTLNLTTFNTSSVTNMDGMFMDCSALTTIYCGDNWNAESSTNMFYGCESLVGASGTTYNSNNVTVAYANPTTGYFSKLIPHVIWCDDNKTLYFLADEKTYDAGDTYDKQTITKVWDDEMGIESGIITDTQDTKPKWLGCNIPDNAKTVKFEESFAYVHPTSTWEWFLNFKNLTTITGLENLNTSATRAMYCMFTSCESLTSIDISTFDMSKVWSLDGMFGGCSSLETVNCGSLDLAGVDGIDISWMFQGCTALTTIYCDKTWNLAGNKSYQMFDGCDNLVGGNGTPFDQTKINFEYARPDGGPNSETPGYFTSGSPNNAIVMYDNQDNSEIISNNTDFSRRVTISGRTLYKDESWNTLCLPFDLNSFDNTPLQNAVVKTLVSSDYDNTNGTLTLNFSEENLTSIEAGKPYIVKWNVVRIADKDDWEAFAARVNAGETTLSAVLTADITEAVTTPVGTESNPFEGTFDGLGHKLTINIQGDKNLGAFGYIKNARILNLIVKGSVNVSYKWGGSIVGDAKGNCTLDHCVSYATIKTTGSSSGSNCNADGTCSGMVGIINDYGMLTISNCAFYGTLDFSNGSNCNAGFVGWSSGKTIFTSCVFSPGEIKYSSTTDCETFVRHPEQATLNKCYYTQSFGVVQGDELSTSDYLEYYHGFMPDPVVLSATNAPDITDPVFANVTVSRAEAQTIETTDGNTNWVDFIGTYSPITFNEPDKDVLYLGSNNTLYYPNPSTGNTVTIGAFRAYFQLKNNLTAGDPNNPSSIRAYNLNFNNEGNSTGIFQIHMDVPSETSWYTLDGRKLMEEPTTRGLYIKGGKKVMIK